MVLSRIQTKRDPRLKRITYKSEVKMFVAEWIHSKGTLTYTETHTGEFSGKIDATMKCRVAHNTWKWDPMRAGKRGQAPKAVGLGGAFPNPVEV